MIDQSIHPACRDFVAVVEQLLQRRQQDGSQARALSLPLDSYGWGPRAWTRTELEDMVYSSYKQMRKGRITRPPRRELVMELADYLNCSLEERNRLLIAAGAPPIAAYLTGSELEAVLRVAIGIAQQLSMPAMIINRDWHIHYVNQKSLTLFGITAKQLAMYPPTQQNVLRLIFDPQMPLYPLLMQNQESWTRMARQTIYGFKLANVLCQFEPWYSDLLIELLELPGFELHWRTVGIDTAFDCDPSASSQPAAVILELVIQPSLLAPQRVRVRPLLVSVGYFQFDFPQIVGFVPADDESQARFSLIGLQVPSVY